MNRGAKIFYNVVGTISVGLAILGAVLPLLPATPFLLLASACYVRGSERLYSRLMTSRFFGAYLTNIRERRGIPFKAKVYTLLVMWASLLFSIYRFESAPLDALLFVTGIIVTCVVLSFKTLREDEPQPIKPPLSASADGAPHRHSSD